LLLRECLDLVQSKRQELQWPVIFAAATSNAEKIPVAVLALFKHEFRLEAPGEEQRLLTLREILDCDILAPDVALRSLSIQTAALLEGDLLDLVARAKMIALVRVEKEK